MKILSITFSLLMLFACKSNNNKELIPDQKKDFCSQIHFENKESLQNLFKSENENLLNKTGVRVLEDGGESLLTRAWLCERAKKQIDIQYFIFSTDNVGLIACDYLVRAADRGVKVRLLIDDILVDAGPYELLTLDAHPNIEIKIYNPGINIGKNITQKIKKLVTDFKGANQRMHNKTFIIDNTAAITGGRNIADEYFDYDHEYNFRDRDVLLIGKEVGKIDRSFEMFWENALSINVNRIVKNDSVKTYHQNQYNRLHQYACNPDNFWPQVRQKLNEMDSLGSKFILNNIAWIDNVEFVSDMPGKNTQKGLNGGGNTTEKLKELLLNAHNSIEIQSPYLVTNQQSLEVLNKKSKDGINIRILTNSLSSTDNVEAFSGYQRNRKQILQAGVRVFEYKPNAAIRYKVMSGAIQKKLKYKPIFGLHAKSMVIDDSITVIGTFNFDPRSMNLNTECVTVIYSKEIALQVKKEMEEEFKSENSWETTLNFNPDKFASKSKQIKSITRRPVPAGIL